MKKKKELIGRKMDNDLKLFLKIFVVILILTELGFLIFGYTSADKIECNGLWCTFTKTKTERNDTIIIRTSQKCFFNGEQIDCNNNSINFPIVDTCPNCW